MLIFIFITILSILLSAANKSHKALYFVSKVTVLPNGYCSCHGITAVDVGLSSEPICEYRGDEADGVRDSAAHKLINHE